MERPRLVALVAVLLSKSPTWSTWSLATTVTSDGNEFLVEEMVGEQHRAIRVEQHAGVRHLVLCRAAEFNTITPQLRDELSDELDSADRSADTKVVLIRADGKAFCAGFGLDWSTLSQATNDGTEGRVWDSAQDIAMIGRFGSTFAKLNQISKPTVAAVHGWCIAGGTDMILNADIIIASESARFGYPPARVWGIPEAPWVWIARLGLERAKRYLFTGDEITGREAARIGLVLECVADDALLNHATALAGRIAMMPMNQLQMMKWALGFQWSLQRELIERF
jgi:enoyl-CoA hydratase